MEALILTNKKVARLERQRDTEAPRIRIDGTLTLYVRTDGSDANSGQANTAAGAFLTIQAALTAAANNFEGTGAIVIQVQAGTWSIASTLVLSRHAMAGGVYLTGDTTTPANNVLNVTTEGGWLAVVQGYSAAYWTIRGFRMQRGAISNCNLIVTRWGGQVDLLSNEYGACGTGAHVFADDYGRATLTGAYSVIGGASSHVSANRNALIEIYGVTITFVGTPSIARWAFSQRNSGIVHNAGGSLAGAVTISTEKYLAQINAYVEGVANMPGAGGSLAWGGQAL